MEQDGIQCNQQPDYEALAKLAYEWLKKRQAKGEISTHEVLVKICENKCSSKIIEQLEGIELFEFHDRLLSLIKKEKEYVADFSAYKDMFVGLPYNIPFVFRKK